MKVPFVTSPLCVLMSLALCLQACGEEAAGWTVTSEAGELRVEVLADSIAVPFGMCFLSDHEMLVTDRSTGEILLLNLDDKKKIALKGVPASFTQGDGGALDILPHPEYDQNGWIYFSHAVGDSVASTMAIDRFRLRSDSVVTIQRIFTVQPSFKEPNHYGNRMAFHQGYLYVTMGDRYYHKDSAQSLSNHLGKVLRLTEEGEAEPDNPFIGTPNALPEIWSYGHRNPQGLAIHPDTGALWLNEHGPKGGDELNRIRPGLNYGWPVICYGVDYDDTPIGAGITHQDGMEQPVHYYTPSIAPGGMAIYDGDKFPAWRGNFLIGALAHRHLNRLVLEGNKVIHEERLLGELDMRVRVVKQGPDGYLYLGVDGGNILRIMPE